MKELLQQALDALVCSVDWTGPIDRTEAAITALRSALAAPQPEPVIGTKTWFEDGKLITMYLTASDIYKAPPATPAHAVPADPWKAAIDDELVCCHIGTTDSFPDAKTALKNLIDWHVQIALDPAVSSDAQALIEKGKSAAPAVPLTDEQINDIWNAKDLPEHRSHLSPWGMDRIRAIIAAANGIGGGK